MSATESTQRSGTGRFAGSEKSDLRGRSLRWQIGLLIAIAVFALWATNSGGVASIVRSGDSAAEVMQANRNAQALYKLDASEAEMNVMGAAIAAATPVQIPTLLQQARALTEDMRATLGAIDPADLDDVGRPKFEQLKATAEAEIAAFEKSMDATGSGGDGVAQGRAVYMAEVAPVRMQFSQQLQELIDHGLAVADQAQADADSERQFASLLVSVGSLVAMVALLVYGLRMSRRIVTNVKNVEDGLEHMGRGDFTHPIDAHSEDELGRMAEAAERMRTSVRDVLVQMEGTSEAVASSGEKLAAISAQLVAGSQRSASSLNSSTGDAEAMSRNVETVAAGTEQMTGSIAEISRSANDAAGVASSAVAVADRTNTTVAKLGESSLEIGNVVKTITSIAEQTNLLALNATIEAARAGEAGKGFAVVANEVKELAQETSKATEDIGRRVEAIQVDTEAAVAAISEISAIIAQINDSQTTIASAVEEQTSTTNEMGRSVAQAAAGATDIARKVADSAGIATESERAAHGVADASGELSQHATDMRAIVGRFRV